MLSIKGVPDELENVYSKYKNLAKEVYMCAEDLAQPERIPADTDLFERAPRGSIAYILEGYFKLNSGAKTLRLYSENDFIQPNNNLARHTLASDFASIAVFFERDAFLSKLGQSKELLDKWTSLQDYENKLNLSLADLYLSEEVQPQFELREYAAGDVITKEGDPPDEIFEMMSGNGKVFFGEQEIGRIGPQEIFGEISFLTESVRTATVIAENRCFVRIVSKEDFFSLIGSNPQLGVTISKTLAKRIVELNDRLTASA